MSENFDQHLIAFERDRLALLEELKLPKKAKKGFLIIAAVSIFLHFGVAIALGIAGLIVYIIEYRKRLYFSKRFQQEIIPEMVGRLSPDFRFIANECVSFDQVSRAGMAISALESVKGSNLIEGTIDGNKVKFSASQYHFKFKKGGKTEWTVGMKGHSMLVELPGKSSYDWFIFPNTGVFTLKYFKNKQEDLATAGYEKVPSGNEAFDSAFVCWQRPNQPTPNTSFASYLLNLKEKLDKHAKCVIALAVKENTLMLCINWSADLFAFTLEKSVTEEIRETLEELQLCLDLPKNLTSYLSLK